MPSQQPHLFLVDDQVDFDERNGALPVGGSAKTALATAVHIKRSSSKYAVIHETFDTHPNNHWSFARTYTLADGTSPVLVGNHAMITEEDLLSGRIKHRWEKERPDVLGGITIGEHALNYVRKVGPIDLWPVHCVPDNPGWTLQPEIAAAIADRCAQTGVDINRIMKGYNGLTDQYGALEAALFIPRDPSTGKNENFLAMAENASVIAFGGLEGAHCVMSTFKQVVKYLPHKVRDFVLLVDLIGVLPNFGPAPIDFTDQFETFLHEMTKLGVTVTTSDKFRP